MCPLPFFCCRNLGIIKAHLLLVIVFEKKACIMGHQLSLSLELILLLDWFLKHGKDRLRLLVNEALKSELATNLESINDRDYVKMLDELHDTVFDFIIFLEDTMVDGLDELDLISGLEGVSSRRKKMALDTKTLLLNVQQAKRQCNLPNQETEQELFKKLLEAWDPATNEPVN